MSCMRCDSCSNIVDTDFDLESLYVTGFECLCGSCRDDLEAPGEFEEPPARPMPANIDAMIADHIASDPRRGCKECDWDVDGCSPCVTHAEL